MSHCVMHTVKRSPLLCLHLLVNLDRLDVLAALESSDRVIWHHDAGRMVSTVTFVQGTGLKSILLESRENIVGMNDLASLLLCQLLCSTTISAGT